MRATEAASAETGRGEVVPTAGALNGIREVRVSTAVRILSHTWGIDFNPYISQDLMPKIQREWSVEIQKLPAAATAKTGTAIVEFAIARDGSITDVKLKQSTKEQALDDAVLGAIRGASPFSPLPAKFRGNNIALRLQCDYNPEPGGTRTTGGPPKE
jgi:TonB family protein